MSAKDEHISEPMLARMAVLTPLHVFSAGRALVTRLRLLHEDVREMGGDKEKASAAHTQYAEALANFIAVMAADDAYHKQALELRRGLEAAFLSAKTLGI